MKVLFLGYGRMGSAMGEAWLGTGLASHVYAVDPSLPASEQAVVVSNAAELGEVSVDCIILAVKPALAATVLEALPKHLLTGSVVVSVAAGVTLPTLRSAVGDSCDLVRAMPNTPVLLGAGCTGLFAEAGLPEAKRALVSQLFQAVGSAWWVEQEHQLDAVTALSGSGPAYYHLFSEALAAAGVALGLDAELAKRLAVDTAFGAATLQRQPDADLAALRQAVTSPNGTTAAAIDVFEADSALRSLVQRAATAAADRAQALSRGE